MHGSYYIAFFSFADLRPELAVIIAQYANLACTGVNLCHQQQSQDYRLGNDFLYFY
jgi:hypothetical protein